VHGEHPGALGREHVVVDAVADVGDTARDRLELGCDPVEERRIGLRDPSRGRRGDPVDREGLEE